MNPALITRNQTWCAELIALGGGIHQDDGPSLTAEDEATQQADVERYLAMLDELPHKIDADVIAAVLWSLHPIEDYGIYQAAYSVLSQTEPTLFGQVAARVLPDWLAKNGDHDSIQTALMGIVEDECQPAFLDGAKRWDDDERAIVRSALTRWLREDESWLPICEALGVAAPETTLDPIPDDWSADWKSAAEAFRATGAVNLAWLDERDFAGNFDRVFALIELGHGERWRDVADLLNPLLVRRRKEIPRFIESLAALPADRRGRILAAIQRARPDTGTFLADLLRNVG